MTDFLDYAKFPSKEEWKAITNAFPIVKSLSVKMTTHAVELNGFEELAKSNDFITWENRFNNKLGKLRFSYVLAASYSPKLKDNNWILYNDDGTTNFFPDFDNDIDLYNKFLFDYFTEAFYYHYFSALDVMAHLYIF